MRKLDYMENRTPTTCKTRKERKWLRENTGGEGVINKYIRAANDNVFISINNIQDKVAAIIAE